jgi:hypothetical protein
MYEVSELKLLLDFQRQHPLPLINPLRYQSESGLLGMPTIGAHWIGKCYSDATDGLPINTCALAHYETSYQEPISFRPTVSPWDNL